MLITDSGELKNFSAENRIWQGIPGIEVTRSGRMFVCFYSGGVKEQLGNYGVLIKSEDGEWFEDPVAVAWPGEDNRCYDPCLWLDPLGRLWFIWADQEKGVCAVICQDPDAEELVWGPEFVIGYGVMLNKPVVLSTGEWLFPVAVWNHGVRVLPAEYDPQVEDRGSFVYRSVDQGRTFEKLGGADVPGRSFDEHMLLECRDGRLAMYVRTNYGIGLSYSEDGGVTWSPGQDSGIWGPDSRFHIRRLPSGRVLLVNHIKTEEKSDRRNLAALLSEDDGRTWKYQLLLDERENVSYPDVSVGKDGTLYVVYDRERGGFLHSMQEVYREAREILYARITEADIMEGRPTEKDSRLKCVLCKLGEYAQAHLNPFEEKELFSEEEFAKLLLEKYPENILDKIFEFYPLPCVDLQKLDREKLDRLAERLEQPKADKKQVVLDLVSYVQSIGAREESVQPMIARLQKLILQNIQEDISVRDLAERVGSSMYYMIHLFKKHMGITVTEFKNNVKLSRAEKMLANSHKSVGSIAQECGFEDYSYFGKLFQRKKNQAPTGYRKMMTQWFPGLGEMKDISCSGPEDRALVELLPCVQLLEGINPKNLIPGERIRSHLVSYPSGEYTFLHEAAVVRYEGVLFAAWYHGRKPELQGRGGVRFSCSYDDGRTWTEPETVAEDVQGRYQYGRPVFGNCGDKLYLLCNQMIQLECMHAVEGYLFDREKGRFEKIWTRSGGFKLNTNVYPMADGRLMMAGQAGETDEFPGVPGLLFSDTGQPEGPWRMVRIQEDRLPDGSRFHFPESACIIKGQTIYLFCRNDNRRVPLVYVSADAGEHWNGPFAHDIPFSDSKIYAGTLSDGRNYLIGNLQPGRGRLAIFFSDPGTMRFTRGMLLQDGFSEQLRCGVAWHYPCAYESDGKLYVIYTVNMTSANVRGLALSVIELDKI